MANINETLIPIPGRLHSVATESHVAGADEIIDDTLQKDQATLNSESAYIDDSESSSAVVPSFDPESQTVHVTAQTLSEQQKAQARENIGLNDLVKYSEQTLTTAQKDQVAQNLNNRPATNGMARIELKATDDFKAVIEAQTGGNTIFVIKYDYTLTGDVTVPANCILKFDGGSISAGSGANMDTITGNDTILDGTIKLSGVKFAGTFSNTEINITENWGTTPDFFGIMQCFTKAKINLYKNIVSTTKDTRQINGINIDGRGHTIKVPCINMSYCTNNVSIKNVTFDLSIQEDAGSNDGFLWVLGNAENNVTIDSVKLINMDNYLGSGLQLRNVKNVTVLNSDFLGTLDSESTYSENAALFMYHIKGTVITDSCSFKNINGSGISILQEGYDANNRFVIQNCTLENIAENAFTAAGGEITNCTIQNNRIINSVCVDPTGKASDLGHIDGVNFHGFYNLQILNNYIKCVYAPGFGLDGTGSSDNPGYTTRGNIARIEGNTIIGSGSIGAMESDDIIIQNNNFILNPQTHSYAFVLHSSNTKFLNNICKISNTTFIFGFYSGNGHAIDLLIDKNIFEVDVNTGNNNYFIDLSLASSTPTSDKHIALGDNKIKSVSYKFIPNINILASTTSILEFLNKKYIKVIVNPSKNERHLLCSLYYIYVTAVYTYSNLKNNRTVAAFNLPFGYINNGTIYDGNPNFPIQPIAIPATIYQALNKVHGVTPAMGEILTVFTDGTGVDEDIELWFEVAEGYAKAYEENI